MTTPLIDRATGDVIEDSHVNDIKDYIEDAQFRVNTFALEIQGNQVIDSGSNIISSGRPLNVIS